MGNHACNKVAYWSGKMRHSAKKLRIEKGKCFFARDMKISNCLCVLIPSTYEGLRARSQVHFLK